MTERDIDIDFDFFDESETREPARTDAAPARGPRRPVRPPTGITPLLRLVGLVASAILIVVLLVFWVQSCRGESKRNLYEDYMDDVRRVATVSQRSGARLRRLLTTQGIKEADVSSRLGGLVQEQDQYVAAAQDIDPPGRLRGQHEYLVDALQFRASGLDGLARTFRRTPALKDADEAARLLAVQAERLVASDVIWDDLFKVPAVTELRRQDISGVRVPDSNFMDSGDLASAGTWEPILDRLRGAATPQGTPTGVHGNGIVSTKVLPSNEELSTTSENTIRGATDLAFVVTVENSGDAQEVQVQVTLTIQKSGGPIVKTQTIDLINPDEQKQVVFRDLPQPDFARRTSVKVDVQPVPGEANTDNNSAEYPVIFSVA